MAKGKAQAVDKQVGLCLRAARVEHGLSQKAVAEALNISLRQVQKYEDATDRVSASRLYDYARLFGCSVDAFFHTLDAPPSGETDAQKRETTALIKHYLAIPNERHRAAFRRMARDFADRSETEE